MCKAKKVSRRYDSSNSIRFVVQPFICEEYVASFFVLYAPTALSMRTQWSGMMK